MIYPNPLPFKLRVLRTLTDIIKEVTPSNGYVSDLSDFDPGDGVQTERVYRGREYFGDQDPLPLIGILEGNDPADEVAEQPVDTPTGEYWWALIVQGWTENDPQHPTDPAYVMMADVRRRLVIERRRKDAFHNPNIFGLGAEGKNRLVDLRVGPGVVRPPNNLSPVAWWWMTLDLRIVDNAGEPYA